MKVSNSLNLTGKNLQSVLGCISELQKLRDEVFVFLRNFDQVASGFVRVSIPQETGLKTGFYELLCLVDKAVAYYFRDMILYSFTFYFHVTLNATLQSFDLFLQILLPQDLFRCLLIMCWWRGRTSEGFEELLVRRSGVESAFAVDLLLVTCKNKLFYKIEKISKLKQQ